MKAEVPGLAEECLGELLGDEDHAGGLTGRQARHRVEPPQRFGIFLAPRVRVQRSHQHLVVGDEAERDERERRGAVDGDELDRRAAQGNAGVEDLQPGFDGPGVLGDRGLEIVHVLELRRCLQCANPRPCLGNGYARCSATGISSTIDDLQRPLASIVVIGDVTVT